MTRTIPPNVCDQLPQTVRPERDVRATALPLVKTAWLPPRRKTTCENRIIHMAASEMDYGVIALKGDRGEFGLVIFTESRN